MSDKLKKEFDETIDRIKREIESLSKRIDEYMEKGDVYRAYRAWRDGVLNSLKILRKALDHVVENIKEINVSEEELKDFALHIRDSVRDIINRIEELGERIRESRGRRHIHVWYTFKPFKHVFHGIAGAVDLTVDRILDSVEELVENIEKALEDVGKKVTQVISVRIKEQDLEIIDKLVDAGIFKSRSEAIAYFARKGIEASKEWIEKALEQAKKIKELQDSIRKEIDQYREDEEQ
ncbi:MAG: ribbon-helix-helix protein, CopG family [Ignisphaera sp.]